MGNIGDNVYFKCGGRELEFWKMGKFEKKIMVYLGLDDACAYRLGL